MLTVERILDLPAHERFGAVRVEGCPAAEPAGNSADFVDFDVLDVDGRCLAAVQAKTKGPDSPMPAPEVLQILLGLIAGADARAYELVTNGIGTPGACRLAEILRTGDPEQIRTRLGELFSNAPMRAAQLRALTSDSFLRRARSRCLVRRRNSRFSASRSLSAAAVLTTHADATGNQQLTGTPTVDWR
ncbi:hypothetical protein [Cryptosporangium sp. NPDC048952]|uniref:hypothetical protein n=1 Tax=Cryptosporangium sp. NPDC048952 TaxID=3363961 RepID=UPI00371E001D